MGCNVSEVAWNVAKWAALAVWGAAPLGWIQTRIFGGWPAPLEWHSQSGWMHCRYQLNTVLEQIYTLNSLPQAKYWKLCPFRLILSYIGLLTLHFSYHLTLPKKFWDIFSYYTNFRINNLIVLWQCLLYMEHKWIKWTLNGEPGEGEKFYTESIKMRPI